jgi:hypothetical protein
MHGLLNARSELMQSRWRVSGNADRTQDVLDIILLALPLSPSDELHAQEDKSNMLGHAWSSIMDEVERILQQLAANNFLSGRKDFRSDLQSLVLLLSDAPLPKDVYPGKEIEGSTEKELLGNLTIDIMLLAEISRHTETSFPMLARLLIQVLNIPESRLIMVLYALKEISER